MSELKPCPFCGSENIAVGSDKGTVYRHNTAFGDLTRSVPTVRWAYCVDCGCVAPAEKVNNFDGFYKPDEQEDALNRAISAWNRRAQPANEPLTLEELREMAQDLMAWCVVHDCEKADCTAIIDYDNLGKYGEKGKIVAVTSAYGEPLKESDYGKTWLAYRRPPEMFIGVDLASGHDFTSYGRPLERSENDGQNHD
jgi:hypothetical protein